MSKTIAAQELYDRRDKYGEISGVDLHELFFELVGDMSPSGHTAVDAADLATRAAQWDARSHTRWFAEGVLSGTGCQFCAHGAAHWHDGVLIHGM